MWFARRFDRRYEADGRVACSLQGKDVEIDECLFCPHLRELGQDSGERFVRCRPVLAPPRERLANLMVHRVQSC